MATDVDDARRRFVRAAERAVTRWGEHVLGEAQRRAPVEEGTLRASGELEVDVDHAAGRVTAELSFNQIYAARQHEETEWEHPLAGEAKYLERPLQESAPMGERLLELELRREGLV